jgi:hypothetical protein
MLQLFTTTGKERQNAHDEQVYEVVLYVRSTDHPLRNICLVGGWLKATEVFVERAQSIFGVDSAPIKGDNEKEICWEAWWFTVPVTPSTSEAPVTYPR